MTVYVDDMEAQFQRMLMCHMWADTYDELRNMALAIDVPFKWLQHPPYASWVHMDISKSKRALAVALGAREMRIRDAIRWKWAQPYNVTYQQFYKDYWRWKRRRWDYETSSFYDAPTDSGNIDEDIPF